jgi:glycosyltransferase involved in cell wall biosynthesis
MQTDTMSRVVMLLSNAFRPDPRVAREAEALARSGYQVTVICWDRQAELPAREVQHGVEILRVQSVPSAYASGWRQLFRLPRFWQETLRLAQPLRPTFVHCHDLDTLYAGWRIKKRLGCRLVYDAHENYPALMSLYLPRILVQALVHWERWLMRHVDATITASDRQRGEYLSRGVEPVITVGNYQDLAPYQAVTQAQVEARRAQLGVAPGDLLVAYIGGFSRNRLLLPLIESAALLSDVCFHLWGDGPQRLDVEQAVHDHPNVWYHGWLPHEALPATFSAADVVYYCLRTDYPGADYNAPNTLAQAMAAGRPIVANDVGDLGRVVQETRCGVLLGEVNPHEIAGAIDRVRNPAERQRLGGNGLRAALEKYNSRVASHQLLGLYEKLSAREKPCR